MNIRYIRDAKTRFVQDDDGWNLIVGEGTSVYEGYTTAIGVAYSRVADDGYHQWEMFKWDGKNWLIAEWKELSFNERYEIVKRYLDRWDNEWWRKVDKVPWDNDDTTVIMIALEQS